MTSGRSVLFAGSTVVISLFGLYLIGQAYMIGLATACIAAVLMVLIAALTLLPAMLGFAGNAIDKLHVPAPAPDRRAAAARTGSGTAGAASCSAGPGSPASWPCSCSSPWRCPLFSMRLAFTDAGNDPTILTTRQAYDLLAQGFGPGFNGPLVIAAAMHGPEPTSPRSTTCSRRIAGPSRRHRVRHPGGIQQRPTPGRSSSSTRPRHRSRPRPGRWCRPSGTT